jgi:hypothetical protein
MECPKTNRYIAVTEYAAFCEKHCNLECCPEDMIDPVPLKELLEKTKNKALQMAEKHDDDDNFWAGYCTALDIVIDYLNGNETQLRNLAGEK